MTCFTASVPEPRGFALRCQVDKGIAADVDYLALRRAEDVRACSILGADFEHLGLPEAPHRGYDSPEALFGDFAAGDDVASALEARLREVVRERPPRAICYPVGVGGHVDHRRVADAVERLRGDLPAVRFLRWYDQPYTARHRRRYPELAFARRARGLAEIGEDVCALSYDPRARAPDGLFARKVRAAAAYRSQVGYQFYEAFGASPAGEPDVEDRIARVLGRREWLVAS